MIDEIIAAIGPASAAQGDAAARHVAPAGMPLLERLARALGAAQHTPRPRATPRKLVVVAGDHGCADPGIAMGADHPTAVAAAAIAAGTSAIVHIARTAHTPIVLVDAGVREPDHLPAIAVRLAPGRPSRDREPTLTHDEAMAGIEAGIALAMTLSEPSAACLAIGAIGLGAEVASAAMLGAATSQAPVGLGDAAAEAAGARGAAMIGAAALDVLATFGGPETAVLAGLMLGAASIDVPVILDGYATGAAALVAVGLAPAVAGYLIAAHRGSFTQPAILEHLGLVPVFEVGLGHGDGTGAALALALIDQVTALAAAS